MTRLPRFLLVAAFTVAAIGGAHIANAAIGPPPPALTPVPAPDIAPPETPPVPAVRATVAAAAEVSAKPASPKPAPSPSPSGIVLSDGLQLSCTVATAGR